MFSGMQLLVYVATLWNNDSECVQHFNMQQVILGVLPKQRSLKLNIMLNGKRSYLNKTHLNVFLGHLYFLDFVILL